MNLEQRNEKLALDLKKFLEKNDLLADTRIYFNNKCFSSKLIREDWHYEYEVLEDIQPSDYFEYANNKTVSMSFEGSLNHILNYYIKDVKNIREKFDKIFSKHKCYYELGHAWNLTVYYDEEV